MPDSPTIGGLVKAKAITLEALDAAIDTYLSGKADGLTDLGGGHTVDITAAIERHEPSRKAFADPEATPAFRRTMTRAAILLARVETR